VRNDPGLGPLALTQPFRGQIAQSGCRSVDDLLDEPRLFSAARAECISRELS